MGTGRSVEKGGPLNLRVFRLPEPRMAWAADILSSPVPRGWMRATLGSLGTASCTPTPPRSMTMSLSFRRSPLSRARMSPASLPSAEPARPQSQTWASFPARKSWARNRSPCPKGPETQPPFAGESSLATSLEGVPLSPPFPSSPAFCRLAVHLARSSTSPSLRLGGGSGPDGHRTRGRRASS